MQQKSNIPIWEQRVFTLKAKKRGCHLVTDEIVSECPEIKLFKIGLFHLLLKHTSASITLNENCDPDVRTDMEAALNRIAPEGTNLYNHDAEGKDDMPAHIKSSVFGAELTIPIRDGRLELGTWQGIWLCEHRNGSHQRSFVATMNGVGFGDK